MAVNGVEIEIGQRWRTDTNHEMLILSRWDFPAAWPWIAVSNLGKRYSVNDVGLVKHWDMYLTRLLDGTESVAPSVEDPNVKATNPKEAMGDKKVPLWLCSPIAEAHWSAAQVAGLLKYGAWNWRAAGVRTSTYLSAIKRHQARYANGERYDPVDGTHHLGHIMACCAILLEAEAIGKLNDDRGPRVDLQPIFDEVEGIIARLKVQYADKDPKHWTINDQIEP